MPRPYANIMSSTFAAQILMASTLVMITLAAGGCKTTPAYRSQLERTTISVAEIDRLHAEYIASDVAAKFKDPVVTDKKAYRDEVIHARLRYIDAHYEVVVRGVYYGRAGKDFAADIAVLTLNAIGGLTGTAATKAILHAISGGIVGGNAALDNRFFQDQATNAIVQKMDASRAVKLELIQRKLDLPAIPAAGKPAYTMAEALRDVDAYFRAGTATRALLELGKSTAAEAKVAEDNLIETEKATINQKRGQNGLLAIPAE